MENSENLPPKTAAFVLGNPASLWYNRVAARSVGKPRCRHPEGGSALAKRGFFTVLLGTAAAAAAVTLRKKGEDYHVEFDVKPSKLGKTAAEQSEGEADR